MTATPIYVLHRCMLSAIEQPLLWRRRFIEKRRRKDWLDFNWWLIILETVLSSDETQEQFYKQEESEGILQSHHQLFFVEKLERRSPESVWFSVHRDEKWPENFSQSNCEGLFIRTLHTWYERERSDVENCKENILFYWVECE